MFSCGLQLQEGGGHRRAVSPVKMKEGRSERETAGKEVDATGQQEMVEG